MMVVGDFLAIVVVVVRTVVGNRINTKTTINTTTITNNTDTTRKHTV